MGLVLYLFTFFSFIFFIPQVSAQELLAPQPESSNIRVKVEYVGSMPIDVPANINSPVAYGSDELLLIDQQQGKLYSFKGGVSELIFDAAADFPDELIRELRTAETILNVVGDSGKSKLYVIFVAQNAPEGAPVHLLPFPDEPSGGRYDFTAIDDFPSSNGADGELLNRDIYRVDAPNYALFGQPRPLFNAYQVLYSFDYVDGVMSNPKAIVAFQSQQGAATHHGGGLAIATSGELIYAHGDNLPFGFEGRKGPQNNDTHVGKLLIINPENGSWKIAAKGIRNVQHLQITKNPNGLGFSDIGGVTSEELNWIKSSDLTDTSVIENFGWGRNADGNAREGTFYISEGEPFVIGTEPAPDSLAPVPEAGFIQPIAQFGRGFLNTFNFSAATGPVESTKSFKDVKMLYGNLSLGEVYAIVQKPKSGLQTTFSVQLVDENGDPLPNNTLTDLGAFGGRSDPRFFLFPDGSAGVLLEATGDFFRLTEVK